MVFTHSDILTDTAIGELGGLKISKEQIDRGNGMAEISCDDCIHAQICRLLIGEMELRFSTSTRDVIKEVDKLKHELADKCRYYMSR